jgi:uncharacterized protein YijF (DUF1287 family)
MAHHARRLVCIVVLAVGVSVQLLPAQAPARGGRGRALSDSETLNSVIAAAKGQTAYTLYYDPAYRRLAYPGGDVPRDRGVCTDVIVRAFRAVGVDLQRLVHEDMSTAFRAYPQQWGLSRPDANIDHRRVPNLMTFFERSGAALPIPRDSRAVLPGDVIAWRLGGAVLHIGIASDERTAGRVMLVHNIGRGAQLEDVLHAWPIIGHYRYF